MIGKMLRVGSLLFAYFCIATIVAQLIGLGMLWSRGSLESGRLMQVMAVLQGVDLAAMQQEAVEARITINPAQPSIEDIIQARAMNLRQIELKEIALAAGKQDMDDWLRTVEGEKEQLQLVRDKFKKQLDEMHGKAVVEGRDNARLLLENLKPKQAKQQILQMLDNGEIDAVVKLLSDMPITKRGKIAREFKASDEEVRLAEILKRVREGNPDADVIDVVRENQEPAPVQQSGG